MTISPAGMQRIMDTIRSVFETDMVSEKATVDKDAARLIQAALNAADATPRAEGTIDAN